LQRETGITTIYVTHDQSEALEMSDQIAVMQTGRIVQIASPRDIYGAPASVFVAEFVGTTNWFDGEIVGREGGNAVVRVSESVTVRSSTNHPGQIGDKVRIAVRPESIELSSTPAESGAPGNHLQGVVTGTGFLGSTTRYIVEAAGRRCLVFEHRDRQFAEGANVTLSFAPEAALLFGR